MHKSRTEDSYFYSRFYIMKLIPTQSLIISRIQVSCWASGIVLILFFSTVIAQKDSIRNHSNQLILELSWGIGNSGQQQFSLKGSKFHPLGRSRIEIGYGMQAHFFSDPKAEMLPGSRRLRAYTNPDLLSGKDIRLWGIGLMLGLNYRINKNIYLSILPEIARVHAGNTELFEYKTEYSPELYSNLQDAKPSPAGLMNPIFRLKGSLQLNAALHIRIWRKLSLSLNYTRIRYEYTTYKLLNFRNDRFMKASSLWGIGISYKILTKE